jgi:hypothetical protein
MKKSLLLITLVAFLTTTGKSQIWKDLKDKAEETVQGTSDNTKGLSSEDVVSGLKEALTIGAEKATKSASKSGGFNRNELIRIPFPEEARDVKELALKVGMSKQVEEFEATMNRAAEKAAAEAVDVLVNAVSSMTVKDGFEILNGNDTAATHYLRESTTAELTQKFTPIVDKAIQEVELTRYWQPLASTYNKNPFKKEEINPDLTAYVTGKALNGLFTLIKQEEKSIRENPEARVTDLLKKVFGN